MAQKKHNASRHRVALPISNYVVQRRGNHLVFLGRITVFAQSFWQRIHGWRPKRYRCLFRFDPPYRSCPLLTVVMRLASSSHCVACNPILAICLRIMNTRPEVRRLVLHTARTAIHQHRLEHLSFGTRPDCILRRAKHDARICLAVDLCGKQVSTSRCLSNVAS